MPIVPLLPEVLPNRSQEPEVFVTAVDNFLGAFTAVCAAIDATAIAFNLNAVQGTSSSTATLSTGNKTFTVSTGKSWLPGMNLVLASTEDPGTVWLNAVVISYSGTSLTVNVLQYFGTAGASVSGWTISFSAPPQIDYENTKIVVKSSPGLGSTNTKIRRFTTVETNTLTNDITYADTAANGASFTVIRDGWYWIRYREERSSGTPVAGISINSNQLTTNYGTSITFANRLADCQTSSISNVVAECMVLAFLVAGDVLRAHTAGVDASAGDGTRFEMRRVSLKGMGGIGGGGGGGGGAPTDAGYIVTALNSGLSNERVLTGTTTIIVDNGTAGQTKISRPAITGDMSIPADSNVATIPANTLENNMFQIMPAYSIKMNNSNLAATPTDFVVPVSCLIGRDATGGIIAIPLGANMSFVGGALTSSGGGGGGGGAPTDATYIVATANGTLSAERVATSGTSIIVDISTTGQIKFKRAALTGDATAPEDSNSLTIPNNTVGNAKAADMPANSVKLNNTAALADPTDFNIPASSLLGRADTGNIAAIPLSANLTFNAGVLSLAGVPLWDGNKFTDLAGSQITFGNGVYTWAGKPAANSLPAYSRITINPSSFAGTHKHTIGPTVVTDLTNWMPDGRQLLARGSGSAASPLGTASGTSATAFNIAAHFQLPAGFFEYAGGGLYIMFKARKTGADANPSTFGVQIGKFNSASNTSIATFVTSAAAGRDVVVEENMRILATGVGNTASFISGLIPRNTGNTAAILTDKTSTAFDTTVAMYVVFTAHCPLNAAATHELTEYEIWWIP